MIKKRVKLLQLNLKDYIFMMVLYLGFFQTVPPIYLHRPPLESHQTQRKFKGKRALDQSIADDLAYKKQKMFYNINDMEDKLNFIDRNYWTIIRKQDKLIICHIIQSSYPNVTLSIVIDSDFAAHLFCNDVEIHRIEEYKIPN